MVRRVDINKARPEVAIGPAEREALAAPEPERGHEHDRVSRVHAGRSEDLVELGTGRNRRRPHGRLVRDLDVGVSADELRAYLRRKIERRTRIAPQPAVRVEPLSEG
jgi:hypothetical protein